MHFIDVLLPGMIERRRGHIAIMALVVGYRSMERAGGYAPTKAALINLTECLYADPAQIRRKGQHHQSRLRRYADDASSRCLS